MDKYACNTLKTRAAFRWWKTNDQLQEYKKYLYEKQEKEDESKLCSQVSPEVIDSVILYEIGEKNTSNFWKKIPIQNVCI
jgi:DNA (cytosine-5)-methyltransferase 1